MRAIVSAAAILFLVFLISPAIFGQQGATSAGYSDVDRIFKTRCTTCHSGEKPAYGLRLDNHKNVMAGGKTGPVVVPGKPKESELYKRIV